MGAGEGAKNMTQEKRLKVYKKMLRLAEKDFADCKKNGYSLYGFCSLSQQFGAYMSELPELAKYRPDGITNDTHWFDVRIESPDANKRIDILKEIINTMTK